MVFCVGAIIALIFFEYYWVGVGAGVGMLLSIFVSAYVDFRKAKEEPVKVRESRKVVVKATPKTTKKVVKKTTSKTTKK